MSNKINIFIPEPCHENWQEMTAVDKDRFCNSCQKKVIDFTRASDREILNAFKQNDHLCGRFLDTQLNRDLIVPKEKNSIWLAASASVISFLGLGNHNLVAQETAKTEQTDKKVLTNTVTSRSDEEIEVSGIVEDDSGPFPGVDVFIKGTKNVTHTDNDGLFRIKTKVGDVLIFQFVGMKNTQMKITNNIPLNLKIKMRNAAIIEGPIVTGSFSLKKRTFIGRLLHKSKYKRRK